MQDVDVSLWLSVLIQLGKLQVKSYTLCASKEITGKYLKKTAIFKKNPYN